jgi:aminomethyltransferase
MGKHVSHPWHVTADTATLHPIIRTRAAAPPIMTQTSIPASGPAISPTPALKTAFHQFHIEHGGKMVDFAGWDMPLHYGGPGGSILDEHNQVRNSGGLFDVSHMGRVRFSGRDARKFLDHVCTRLIFDMTAGQVRYSLVCNESGGCRDDVLVYRLGDAEFIMVVNASNRVKLLKHFEDVKVARGFTFKMADETQSTAMVALQGPKVIELISAFSTEIPALKRYRFAEKNLIFMKLLISRTGYTGEDGVEVILPSRMANQAVGMLMGKMGGDDDAATIKPAGLGARDSLRLEAGMPLYGHEITEELDPVSAGLNFAIKLDKGADNLEIGSFIGQDALQRISKDGPKRKLVGLKLEGKRSPRQGMKVMRAGKEIGFVTSGGLSPTLGYPIAMGYVDAAHSAVGTAMQIDLGKATAEAHTVPMPFYKAK